MKNTFIVLLSASLISTFVFMNGPVNVAVSEPTNATSELLESTASQESTFNSANILKETNFSNTNGTNATTTIESTTETTTKSDSTTPDTSLEKTKKVTTFAATTDAVADGSEGNPYLVATFAELEEAVKKAIPSGSDALYIQLTADLKYNSESLAYNKNTVVNGLKDPSLDATDPGNHYAILYTGDTTNNSKITASGQIKLTYKNINIGNSEYPDNTYYGFVQLNSGNNTFEIENIYYNVRNGAQPFYAGGSGNSIIFKGVNTFICDGQTHGGEFSEGYQNIVFESGSKTTIFHDSNGGTALFWDDPMSISLLENSVVSIKSSKRRLFFGGNFSIDIATNAAFSFEKIEPTNNKESGATGNNEISNGGDVNINVGQNTTTIFSSAYWPINMQTTNITANEPNFILFDFPIENKNFMAGTINLTRPQIETPTNYQLNYLNNGIVNPLVSPFLLNHTERITTSNPSGTNQGLIYEQDLSLTGVTGTPNASVSENKSQIEADIGGFVPNDRTLTSVDYLLSKKSLHGDGDINSTDVQQAILDAFNSTDSSYLRKTVTLTTENTDTRTIFENLAGGDYYLYARATGEITAGFPSTTLWVTTASEPLSLAKVINTDIPINMIFKSPTTVFGKAENAEEYEFINNSNIPIAVDLTKVARTDESDSTVKLATSLAQIDTYKLLLNLATNYTDETNNPLVWGPLTEGPISEDSKAILLEPFWETDKNQAEVYLTGNYSGPVSEVKKVAYNFTFTISAQ
ncbi:hypothetical protein [Enterococcus sp. S86.2]|uniref:hypothetical protein n=1 Tax=Enterococcus sp. S86.2 TaxID=3031299 RepID=UPI0026E9F1AD|nr:hypothetical protein [Enterococcus sp. S86.2]